MDSVIATVSGYHGSERFKLIKLISQAGASYVGAMNPSTTHLFCWKFEGKKYELAKKFKMVIVNHRWIEECAKQGRRVPEGPFTKSCGLEVGPLKLDIPIVDKVSGRLLEVSSNCNVSKDPIIDIQCDESQDDAWTDSRLLKENLLPELRRNQDRSCRLKRKGTKRSSRQDDSRHNGYNLDEPPSLDFRRMESEDLTRPSSSCQVSQKRTCTNSSETSRSAHRLVDKNICNEVFESSSASEEDRHSIEIHYHDLDNAGPSKYRRRHESRRFRNVVFQDHVEGETMVSGEVAGIEELDAFSNLEDPTHTDVITSSLSGNPIDHPATVDDDLNGMEPNPRLSRAPALSCVICWTDFSSTRGVLPCGHRFCFSCIQSWADRMASMGNISTCPLCKGSFFSIKKMDDAVSSDQKIYSQTIPNNPSAMDVYILPHGEASAPWAPPSLPVCYRCSCREPEELLIRCYRCQIRSVHSYCLDPPQSPWVCIQCKDLRMAYNRSL